MYDSNVSSQQLAYQKAILEKVILWINMLAENKYLEAFNFTLHDEYYKWTPELMENVISNYGSVDEVNGEYFVTKLGGDMLSKFLEHVNFQIYGVVEDSFIEVQLPLNGEISDLTATFRIPKSGMSLELNDIHVL